MSINPLELDKALVRLENMCARSEYSEGEVRTRLRKWGVSASEASRIIDCLRRNRFLDDERFASSYVRDKYRYSRWGRMKIRAGLAAAGVEPGIALRALESIDPEEYFEGLRHVLKKKNASIPAETEPYERKIRLMRFAAGRGFEPALITKAISILD